MNNSSLKETSPVTDGMFTVGARLIPKSIKIGTGDNIPVITSKCILKIIGVIKPLFR